MKVKTNEKFTYLFTNVPIKIHHYNKKKKKEKDYHTQRENSRIHFSTNRFYSISTIAFPFFFFFNLEEHLETFGLERSFKKA